MNSARISAGNNLSIDMTPDHWRLVVNGDNAERVLVEAASGEPLRYMPTFGQRRRLPDTGILPTLYVQRVVLGWSVKDEAWHLGLLLESELASARGSRWCEIAHWPDPERDLYVDDATRAGTALASIITRPFDLIPPRDETALPVTAPAVAPATPAYTPLHPLPSLPIDLDEWKLSRTAPDTLEFKRSGAWTRAKLLRVFWYLLFTIVYLVLSIKTLEGRIALPKPEFLPYLGLLSAGILLLLAIGNVLRIGRTPNRIVVEAGRGVTALRGRGKRWHVPVSDIDSVYASQVVSRKVKRDKRTIHYGELSLLLNNGKFRRLLYNNQAVEKAFYLAEDTPAQEEVVPLNEGAETSLQAAAAYVAQSLGLPAWYDQRLK